MGVNIQDRAISNSPEDLRRRYDFDRIESEIKKIGDIENKLYKPIDFITEKGVTENGSFEKWDSGKYIYKRKYSLESNITIASTTNYRTAVIEDSYPTGFTEDPYMYFSNITPSPQCSFAGLKSADTNKFFYYLYYPVIYNDVVNWQWQVTFVGRWK